MTENSSPFAAIPSVDRLLKQPAIVSLSAIHGRIRVRDALRDASAQLRAALASHTGTTPHDPGAREAGARIVESAIAALEARDNLGPVINLTGTVLHTNLGRAPLPEEAVAAVVAAAGNTDLEMDLESGRRGDRDHYAEQWLCRLTGAEAATVVNNNAAAVLLTLNTLASRREVPLSRGELVEIGGAFRIPDVMKRAGARLVEVGTTNRTHIADYAQAIGPRTALLMKVHTSNYEIKGFTASVGEAELANLAKEHGLPTVSDLGSGALVDLSEFGLPREPTPQRTIADGMDLVTFSGDKLLGGPQCGLIVGRADLIAKIKRNPMKRALRVDKLTLAALGAVLSLYADPERVVARVPSLRMLARSVDEVEAQAARLLPEVRTRLEGVAKVSPTRCESQVGSGAIALATLPSAGLALTPLSPGGKEQGTGSALNRLAHTLRRLAVPVVGRVERGQLVLDFRCLEDESGLLDQLSALRRSSSPG